MMIDSQTELLDRFIREKLDAYEAPPESRKGIPRGEKRGYPQEKYHATLLALTDLSVRDQAEKLGVSYPVLKNWRSEPEFQAKVGEHQTHFCWWLSAKQSKTPSSDWPSAVLKFFALQHQVSPSEIEQHWHQQGSSRESKETTNRLTLQLFAQALEKSTSHPKTWKDLEITAIDRVTELLQDRNQTIRYRRDIAKLLSTIRAGLSPGKE
jgi:hypothetical protein